MTLSELVWVNDRNLCLGREYARVDCVLPACKSHKTKRCLGKAMMLIEAGDLENELIGIAPVGLLTGETMLVLGRLTGDPREREGMHGLYWESRGNGS